MILMTESKAELEKAYKELMGRAREFLVFQSVGSIIGWDMETKMPPRGINLRSQQLALLQKIGYRMLTDPVVGKLIEEIVNHAEYEGLSQVQKRNVQLSKKEYDEATKLPEELVVETARQRAITTDVWKKAKVAKDYEMFKPELQKIFDLRVRAAEILMDVKGTKTPYDALIDIFEPKMTTEAISRVFNGMRKGLVDIIAKCRDAPRQPNVDFLNRKVPIDVQRRISDALAEAIE